MTVNMQSIEHRSKSQNNNKKYFFLYCTIDGTFKALENLNAYLPVQTASRMLDDARNLHHVLRTSILAKLKLS